jgi:hypothetical protein
MIVLKIILLRVDSLHKAQQAGKKSSYSDFQDHQSLVTQNSLKKARIHGRGFYILPGSAAVVLK